MALARANDPDCRHATGYKVRQGIRGCKDAGVEQPILNNPLALANVTSRRGVAPTSGFACAPDYSRLDLRE